MTQLQAFLLTLCIEVPLACLLMPWRRVGLLALLATTLTHPFVWWLNQEWTLLEPWPRLFALEIGAVAVESAVYFVGIRDLKKAVLLGFVTNAASFALGLALYALMR